MEENLKEAEDNYMNLLAEYKALEVRFHSMRQVAANLLKENKELKEKLEK